MSGAMISASQASKYELISPKRHQSGAMSKKFSVRSISNNRLIAPSFVLTLAYSVKDRTCQRSVSLSSGTQSQDKRARNKAAEKRNNHVL